MSAHSSITNPLAHLIVASQPDTAVIDLARDGVTDFIACALPVWHGAVADSGLAPLKSVYPGHDSQTRSLLLGYAGHALDFDDFHSGFRGHPGTVILPALLALAGEQPAVTETQFLTAYAIGVETAGRLGLAAGPRHYSQGYHNTATLGTIAAAAATCRLTGATPDQTANALGLAASQAAGLRAQFGSAMKPLHAGLAARAGLSATQLALAGFHGNHDTVLDAFLAAHGDGQHHSDALITDWGNPWRLVSPGLTFKRYPTCGGTHSAAEAAFILQEQWLQRSGQSTDDLPAAVDRITVAFPPGGDAAPFIRQATTGVEGRFSLEYVIAAALLEGELRLDRFTEGPVDPRIAALADKVSRQADLSAPPDEQNPDARFHDVSLWLKDGSRLDARVTWRQTAAVKTDVAAKLRQTLSLLPQLPADKVLSHCQLRTPGSLAALVRLLS
ncbi:MmgE/PrpD family protein [Dickeya solani]|uniref:MmgE/PrpD family protein n=1 Tax=Dickeya solani TaxID=1089444 RepID=A0ABU4EHR6_9GAMM|nr:MmgE/PrpD family protein [Dickeya solani]MCA7000308.1 MmgE/PrpD family protein [Dickeya solani]MCZ0784613.1 MmgE/PrpD family protein [Dickeya solani]MCZ0789951.1 MmgE/PrpD family protein [Dickeya solani]MCZ0799315.1 MmgE/PrpD family protein [Dickeya solani]MCZ0805300.1 MmgE/PrpD family protein [Dickeya solani]